MQNIASNGPFVARKKEHNIKLVSNALLYVPRIPVPTCNLIKKLTNHLTRPIVKVNPYRRWAMQGEARHAESQYGRRTGTTDCCVSSDAASGTAFGIQAYAHESHRQFPKTVDTTDRRDDRSARGGFSGDHADAVCRASASAHPAPTYRDSQEAATTAMDRRSASAREERVKFYQYRLFDTKTCSRCRNIFPTDQFYRSKGKHDGRDCYCRDCRLEIQKSPSRKASLRRVSARHRLRHPDREFARQMLGRAVRAGRIKPKPCKRCGSQYVQAHHPDYSKPLDVVWLCRKHHHEHHLQERAL
jgi:hypothetical protein